MAQIILSQALKCDLLVQTVRKQKNRRSTTLALPKKKKMNNLACRAYRRMGRELRKEYDTPNEKNTLCGKLADRVSTSLRGKRDFSSRTLIGVITMVGAEPSAGALDLHSQQ